jgi:DNA-directed RNA polymerase specialized sigma24 family protein
MDNATLEKVGEAYRQAHASRDAAIVKARASGMSLAQISTLTGVSIGAIRNIVERDGK